GDYAVRPSSLSTRALSPMLTAMPKAEGHMNEHKAPSPEELNAYIVLIRFLRQVHSHMQDINVEAERFNKLLEQQCEVLNEHRLDVEDLTSALSEYEVEMERVKSIDLPKQRPAGSSQEACH